MSITGPIESKTLSDAQIGLPSKPAKPEAMAIHPQIVRRILEESFAAQLRDFRAFHRFGPGEITILVGTSTAGKSSIISALRKLDPECMEQGIDMAGRQQPLGYLGLAHRETLVFLQSVLVPKKDNMHILDAVYGKKFIFHEHISEADQARAKVLAETLSKEVDENLPWPLMENRMLDEVMAHSICGKSTVFDILEIEGVFQHALSRNFHAPVKTALVYCPFKLLTERMAERNRKALANKDYHEVRAGPFPLFQFAKLFGPKQNANDLVTETLTRNDVEKAFDINFDCWVRFIQSDFPEELAGKDLAAEKAEGKQKLLQALGFTDPAVQQVELTPRFKRFDFLIDTSQNKPDRSAKILKGY